jgi:hypothetical protein
MGTLEVSLQDIYRGFVNSFATQGIPGASGNFDQSSLETAAVLMYFARLGTMLGYIVVSECKRRDLEWFAPGSGDKARPVLHLESENSYGDVIRTLKDDLGKSDALLRVGYFWVNEGRVCELEGVLEKVPPEHAGYLVIARVSRQRNHEGDDFKYEIRGWVRTQDINQAKPLESATLVWSGHKHGGSLYAMWGWPGREET